MQESLPERPLLRYLGGKWKMAPHIIKLMPKHRIYTESYGGGASTLLRKRRVAAECYNDLDSAMVNLFRVLQGEKTSGELLRRLFLTPYAREEFERCYEPPTDEIDWAAKTVSLSYMGFGSDSVTRGCRTGFRAKMSDMRALPSQHWADWPDNLLTVIRRMRGVTIENVDAARVIERYDAKDAPHYVDPPYVLSTRSAMRNPGQHGYKHELTDEEHETLAGVLHECKGFVLLSGYDSDLYRRLYADWSRVEFKVMADGAKVRTEVLWANPRCISHAPQMLFEVVNG